MFRRRTCAILWELKVPDEICLRYVMGAEDSEGGCWVSYVQSVEDTCEDYVKATHSLCPFVNLKKIVHG
jgi:hypothetical protein